MNGDRDVFVTEDIRKCFKAESIKGATFVPLFGGQVEERPWQALENQKQSG